MITKAMSEKMSTEEREMFASVAEAYLKKHAEELLPLASLLTKMTIGFSVCGKFLGIGNLLVNNLRPHIIFDYQVGKKFGVYTNAVITGHKYALRQLVVEDGKIYDDGEYMVFQSLTALIDVFMNVRVIASTLYDLGDKLEEIASTVNEYLEKQSREDMSIHKVK